MKNKLVTPMGEITIWVDDVEIQYTYIEGDKIEHLCHLKLELLSCTL